MLNWVDKNVPELSVLFFGLLSVLLVCISSAEAQVLPISNPSFELGTTEPESWELSHGEGFWLDDAASGSRSIAVVGDGTEAPNSWQSEKLPFKPDTVYRLQIHARRVEGNSGSLIMGTLFNNFDYSISDDWQCYTSYFKTPSTIHSDSARLSLGQWSIDGIVAYDAVELVESIPVHRRWGNIELGVGEHIKNNRYTFRAPYHQETSNHTRSLQGFSCFFNRPRWVMEEGGWVIYHHNIGDMLQHEAEVGISVGHYVGGEVVVEVSTDGETWKFLGSRDQLGMRRIPVPEEMLPAKDIWVRFHVQRKTEGDPATNSPAFLQVDGYQYLADIGHDLGVLSGHTYYMAQNKIDDRVKVDFIDLGSVIPGQNTLQVALTNTSEQTLEIKPDIHVSTDSFSQTTTSASSILIPPVATKTVDLAYEIPETGDMKLVLELQGDVTYSAETSHYISPLFAHDYGALLPDSSDTVGLWWASSGWKVSRCRPLPEVTTPALRIQAARNEREAAQVVLRPNTALSGLRVQAQSLVNADGDMLPASAVEVLQVGYVPVIEPSDKIGVAAPWPDPILPLDKPINLTAGENQPLWVLVYVPENTPAGVYTGSLLLEAENWQAQVPMEVEVFDFTLPDRMTCQTAFGMERGVLETYHRSRSDEDRQALAKLYFEKLSKHHISPYESGAKIMYPSIPYSFPNQPKWRHTRRVPDDTASAGGYLEISANILKMVTAARYDEKFEVPEDGVTISLTYKSEVPEQRFMLYLRYFDNAGEILTNADSEFILEGSDTWHSFETKVESFPEGAAEFMLYIKHTPSDDSSDATGSLHLDQVRIHCKATGDYYIDDDFTPYTEDELAWLYRPEFDWEPWDNEMQRILDTYHFNAFVLRTPGLGIGAGWSKDNNQPGEILGLTDGTPEYEVAFNFWYHLVQEHLREKGWLEKAYIYWYDEPEHEDYPFVMHYNLKIKEAAPDLQRMLTEEVTLELAGGPNLWCPLTHMYDHDVANARRAEGDRFWWYVCTMPKTPYAGLLIDHPAVDMRVWLWQTWQYNIEGILVWHLTYWHSGAAHPRGLQNPYDDPMAWFSNPDNHFVPYKTAFWGNGDGRFLYPPLAIFENKDDSPVIEAPNGSIRLEMLRDGIEDFEYLEILRKLIDARPDHVTESELAAYKELLVVPAEISISLTEFTWRPEPIETRREAIAQAIERLKP